MAAQGALSAKGARRRADIVTAASELLRDQGPAGVTHRAVSERCGCSLSATTYYFDGIDNLLAEAATRNVESWTTRARSVLGALDTTELPTTTAGRTDLLLSACLPGDTPLPQYYQNLLAASQSPLVSATYRRGRIHLDEALDALLAQMDVPLTADQVYAVVDGAAVSAISEGRDVRENAARLLTSFLAPHEPAAA